MPKCGKVAAKELVLLHCNTAKAIAAAAAAAAAGNPQQLQRQQLQ